MAAPATVTRSSRIAAPASAVWGRAVSPDGINDELRPWLRMTVPRRLRGVTVDSAPVGERLGRSWLLLFGAVPVDYDDLCLAEVGPGLRFLERSSMLTMSLWRHERTVEDLAGSECRVTDTLSFRLRRPLGLLPGSVRLAAAIVAALFAHRHRRLAAFWGGLSEPRRRRGRWGATPRPGR